jgi:hypothetical protein
VRKLWRSVAEKLQSRAGSLRMQADGLIDPLPAPNIAHITRVHRACS